MNNIYIINNGNLKAEISTHGAAVNKLFFYDTQIGQDGIIVGRYANRIKGGSISLDGTEYILSRNEGSNTLHGGITGFDAKEWDIEECGSGARLTLCSPDRDQGFPGNLKVSVTYTLTDNDELVIDYEASTDRPTVLNLTNHLYFNLNGGGKADAHSLLINAGFITETDDELIPTGRLTDVTGTRYDHRILRDFVPSFDDNFVIDPDDGSCNSGNDTIHGLRFAAKLIGRESSICMKVYTDQPGVQLYNTKTHICLETQHFADSPHRQEFPSTILRPGDVFRSRTVYAFERLNS